MSSTHNTAHSAEPRRLQHASTRPSATSYKHAFLVSAKEDSGDENATATAAAAGRNSLVVLLTSRCCFDRRKPLPRRVAHLLWLAFLLFCVVLLYLFRVRPLQSQEQQQEHQQRRHRPSDAVGQRTPPPSTPNTVEAEEYAAAADKRTSPTFPPTTQMSKTAAFTSSSPAPSAATSNPPKRRDEMAVHSSTFPPPPPVMISTTTTTDTPTSVTLNGVGVAQTTRSATRRPRLPRRPASWADGGGSVRVARAFTVLSLVTGPPLTPADVAGENASATSPMQLLRRAAVGLYVSGVARHPSFYEWLILHNHVFSGGAQQQGEEEEERVVEAWWAAAQASTDLPQQQGTTKREEQYKDGTAVPSVRVEGLPSQPSVNPHATKRAFALLYGVRLVATEFVLLHDLNRVLVTAAPAPSIGGASLLPWVHREISMGLQTLSRNGFNALPDVMVDQARTSAAAAGTGEGEDVHAYRLQVYVTVDRQDSAREAQLQTQLVNFIKRVLQPSASPSNREDRETAVQRSNDTYLGNDQASRSAEVGAAHYPRTPHPTDVVQAGLPVAAYSTSPHFQCQRAPLYGIRMPVPAWMSGSKHNSKKNQPQQQQRDNTTTIGRASHNTSATPVPHNVNVAHLEVTTPPLSTLCEVLLSRQSGMPADYAASGDVFYIHFCQQWWYLTLLQRDNPLPRRTGTAENPLARLGPLAGNRNAPPGEDADAFTQKMDMLQSLGDGLCTVQWLAYFKAAQQHYREEAERRRAGRVRPPSSTTIAHRDKENDGLFNVPSAPPRSAEVAVLNIAGASPYLSQFAALLFSSDDTAQLSRLAGTYLAFLPNVSYALQHLRQTMDAKLARVSLHYAVERTRRHKSQKEVADREVVCLPSDLSRVDLHASLYPTQWFLSELAMRCLRRKEACFGGMFDSDLRVSQNVERYLSTTGKWSRGEYRVCMSAGVYVTDPLHQLS